MSPSVDGVELLRRGAIDDELRLRPATDDDRELLVKWFSDPTISVPWCGLHVIPQAELDRRFSPVASVSESGGSFIAVANDKPVGYLGYSGSALGDVSVHIVLVLEARRRGLGTRALRLLGDLLIAALAPPRLIGCPTPDNKAVIRALLAAGFVQPNRGRALFERVN